MKTTKSILAILVSFSTWAPNAWADFSGVNCHSLKGTEHQLELVIVDSDVKQLRISSPADRRPRALPISRLLNQNLPGYIVYSVTGLTGQLLEVENKVLLQESQGHVRLAGETFSCD